MGKPGNPIAKDDMAPKLTEEVPTPPGAEEPAEAPETEHIEDDGEPLGANFA